MKWFAGALLLMPSLAFADLSAYPPGAQLDFGGGLNVGSQASMLAPNESPDMSNMINGSLGEASRRNGSRRYNNVSISTFPITSLYRHYVSSNNTNLKGLLVTSKDAIYFSSNDTSPSFVKLSSGHSSGQRWRWVTQNNKAIGCPNDLKDDIKSFDLTRASMTNLFQTFTESNTARISGRYPIVVRDYFILGNTAFFSTSSASDSLIRSTTYYPSRAYYSLVGQPSSMTVSRFLDIRTDDGEEITGVGESNGFVHFFKETSIMELEFTQLNLTPLGGDQVLRQVVKGFGLFAPDTLANTGDGYIIGAKDGLRFWDGGRKTRLEIEQESRVISDKIKPIIERLIRFGTYRRSIGRYYPKKQWYIFAYEDPLKEPRGKINSALVLDLKTATWWPFANWRPEAMVSMDGIGDRGELLYGDGDGFIMYADDDVSKNDARRELTLNAMDRVGDWTRGVPSLESVQEGTASVKMTVTDIVKYSSITSMGVYNMNKWQDGSKVSADDFLTFRVLVTSLTNFTSMAVQLEVDDDPGPDFDSAFTSITITNAMLTGGNSSWTLIQIPISSFPIQNSWTDLSTELFPFADAQVFYGIRFVATGTAGFNMYIDDIRIAEKSEQALNCYWFSKLFDMDNSAEKRFRKVILNSEVPRDGLINVDSYNEFSQFVNRDTLGDGFPKDLYVFGYNGSEGITKLSSIDFSVKDATLSVKEFAAFRSGTADKNFIYAGDIYNHRLFKVEVGSFTHFVSSFGSFGTRKTQFNNIFQIAQNQDKLYICDFGNHRLKVHSKSDLAPLQTFGELGKGTTNLHLPTGVAVDDVNVFIADDGNRRILTLGVSTLGFVAQDPIPTATFGNTRLQVDEKYLYAFYGTVSSTNSSYIDLILEKRDKTDRRIIARTTIRPFGSNVAVSSNLVMGDMGQNDDFIFISFSDDFNGNGRYYIQKIFKSDISLNREYISALPQYGLAGNGLAWQQRRSVRQSNLKFEGSQVQVKYSEGGSSLDNNFKLYRQSFLYIQQPLKEKD